MHTPLNLKVSGFFVKLSILLHSEEGQDLIEYALVVALIAFGATGAMTSLASKMVTAFGNIGTQLSTKIA
jgi:pilus assembly protein Flp/PilA